jgi:two-component system, OmpR family, sensor kinase
LRYVGEHVSVDGGKLQVDPTNDYRQRLRSDGSDEVLVEVWQGRTLGYSSDAALGLPPPEVPGWQDVVAGATTWHTFVVERGDRLIRVAQARDARWEALTRVAVNFLWPVVTLVPLLAAFLWFGIGYGLKPLREIASELSRRDASSWVPVTPKALPSEVKPLVDALNDMIRRLEKAFHAQGEFVADAAHELRTPTMALSVYAELAQYAKTTDERSAALEQVHIGAARLNHLTQQLLAMARTEAGALPTLREPVDLLALSKSVVLDQIHLAEGKQQDLGLAEQDAATVQGDPANLRVLLMNLVDNAIRYTPAHGRIDVAVRSVAGVVVLEVRDDGPGIPVADRARVLDRFYRGSHQGQQGSGLGLAIIKRIADHHGATLSLDIGDDARGLQVKVTFPGPGCSCWQ